jgi:hypothetical protein
MILGFALTGQRLGNAEEVHIHSATSRILCLQKKKSRLYSDDLLTRNPWPFAPLLLLSAANCVQVFALLR